MSDEFNELRQQIAVLQERINTMEANAAKHKAEGDTAIERLRVSFEGLRTDMAERSESITKTIMISVGVGVAVLSLVIALVD